MADFLCVPHQSDHLECPSQIAVVLGCTLQIREIKLTDYHLLHLRTHEGEY